MAPSSAVYVGTLRHRRFAPVGHEFTYPLFMVLLDIDRIPELMAESAFTSCNRWNWASYDDRDHCGGTSASLRARLAADADRIGLGLPDGRIFLLTHLRYLGYCFNPISLYYCYDRQESLRVIMAEVSNTFGGSHNYWLRPETRDDDRDAGNASRFRASAAKALYVSPFMETALDYTFAIGPVAESLVVHMNVLKSGSRFFDATLSLSRRPWTAAVIRRALFSHPFMTGTVIAGIHWEALRLWWKGVPAVPRPVEH